MIRSPKRRPPAPIPSYGVLIGRMIFVGGTVLAFLGLGFLIMLGVVTGSLPAMLFFGTLLGAGATVSFMALRDLTGPAQELRGLVVARNQHRQGGNPNYELRFLTVNPALKDARKEISYNVTQQDWERLGLGDQVVIRYSPRFRLLIDIRLVAKGS